MKPGDSLQPLPTKRKLQWELIYVNLMTLLMIFFMVLYSMESVGQITGREAEAERIIGTLQEMFGGDSDQAKIGLAERRDKEALEAGTLTEGVDQAEVVVSQDRIKLILPSPVLFASGSAELRPEALRGLKGLAAKLESFQGRRILIEGYTDDRPLLPDARYKDNFELSAARAIGIVELLTGSARLDPARLIPIGFGEFRPAASNETPGGRAKNRRIEIHIMREL